VRLLGPADASPEIHRAGGDQDPLGDAPLVVGVGLPIDVRHRDGDGERRLADVASVDRDLADPAADVGIPDDDELPRLGVHRTAGPAADLEERLDVGLSHRLVREAPDLPRPAECTQDHVAGLL
jgi:hypothetical protein